MRQEDFRDQLTTELCQFVFAIAELNYDGEVLEDGSEFVLENDDAVQSIGFLVQHARSLAKQVEGNVL